MLKDEKEKRKEVAKLRNNQKITKTDVSIGEGKYAYATLVMKGDAYVPGALILAHSLKCVGSQVPLICMVTEDVSRNILQMDNLFSELLPEEEKIKLRKVENTKDTTTTSLTVEEREGDREAEKKEDEGDEAEGEEEGEGEEKVVDFEEEKEKEKAKKDDVKIEKFFDKIMFLDSGKVVLKNIDHIFDEVQCPAGTFSNPWATRKRGRLKDYYPPS